MEMPSRWALAVAAIVAVAQPPAAAAQALPSPVEKRLPTANEQIAEADRAMKEQRYSDAVAILRPLAEAGSAQAQERMGDAYTEGRGVPRNSVVAKQWYEMAGLQGVTNAQLKLGVMFASGKDVPRNDNFAYVWYGTAARLGSGPGKTEQDKVGNLLQPAEREQGDKVISAILAGMKKP